MNRARTIALDPRLLVGVALVAASVTGVWALVSTADDTVPVFAASAALTPGDRVDANDLTEVRVRMDAADLYVAPGGIPAEGLVVTRPVAAGELVAISATGSAGGLHFTSLVLSVEGQLAAAVGAGASVDIWAAHEVEPGTFGAPTAIVTEATVVRLVESHSIVGAGETTAVEVLVPKTTVALVLEAVANNAAISVVPATLPGLTQ